MSVESQGFRKRSYKYLLFPLTVNSVLPHHPCQLRDHVQLLFLTWFWAPSSGRTILAIGAIGLNSDRWLWFLCCPPLPRGEKMSDSISRVLGCWRSELLFSDLRSEIRKKKSHEVREIKEIKSMYLYLHWLFVSIVETIISCSIILRQKGKDYAKFIIEILETIEKYFPWSLTDPKEKATLWLMDHSRETFRTSFRNTGRLGDSKSCLISKTIINNNGYHL